MRAERRTFEQPPSSTGYAQAPCRDGGTPAGTVRCQVQAQGSALFRRISVVVDAPISKAAGALARSDGTEALR